ncbi:hypothetical protein C8F01DRAFT_1260213 [Mycena amicta]|nr:hypothetical protein C8F01DRAFT_1260213 [Mycena amicta]
MTTKRKPIARTPRNSTFEFDTVVSHPSADQGFHYRRHRTEALPTVSNVAPSKRARVEDVTDSDPYADWVDVPETDNGEFASIAGTLSSHDTYHHFIEEDETKCRRYTSSDDPMKLWRADKHLFLDHLCHDCLEERHRLNPLHCVKEWTGEFWSDVALHKVHIRDKSPRSLNFVYQLGHHGGRCISPASSEPQNMVVIHVGGVFTLRVRFCGCAKALGQDHITQLMSNGWYPATTIDPATCATFEALEQFRLLNVVGNLSAHDYVGTLERITDATLLGSTPDRYKAFSRMSRQYQFLKRAKRAGIAHDMAKMERVKIGGMAVRCWACPRAGFNLPEGWERCDKDDEFLYSLMLALDANFRLKNRLRANEKHDPSLGPGWGYFVDSEPYKDHIRDYVAENDVSTCIAFAALMQKDTRLTMGLRISGVGGCVCARHGIVRAEGLGDLQKGERRVYANMDYILLHALGDARVKQLLLSYDIACQWRIHLRERVLKIADEAGLLPDLSNFDIRFGLPVWHAAAHEVNCQEAMSLSHLHGVGRTDGEGIERTWAILNPISFATKEMGEGNRLDSIEDKVDHVCFEKNVGQGDTLGRKIVIAVAERDKQIAEFVDIDRGLEPDLRREWRQQVTDWLADETKPNPYIMAGGKDAGPSEAQVAADLRKAEAEEMTTATGFIKGLLQLEDFQRRIKHEVRSKAGLTADRTSQIEELRATFFKKLKSIQKEQESFMPGVEVLIAAVEERRDRDLPPPKAEDSKLWLPSSLSETQRAWVCRRGLVEVEAKLREAQCRDALGKIRAHLYTKTHLIHARNAITLIERVGDRTEREFAKYVQAWTALCALKGNEHASHLKELRREHLNVRTQTESDARARIKLGRLGSERRGRNEPSASAIEQGAKGVSWIWTAVSDDDEEVQIHEAVRVHWVKSLARRDRWIEEVQLLREERKRVLRSLAAVQAEWRLRISSRTNVEPRLASGLAAYARRQVAVHLDIARSFYASWHTNAKAALKEVLGLDRDVHNRLYPEWKPFMQSSVNERMSSKRDTVTEADLFGFNMDRSTDMLEKLAPTAWFISRRMSAPRRPGTGEEYVREQRPHPNTVDALLAKDLYVKIVLDNCQKYGIVHEHGIGKASKMLVGTAATAVVLEGAANGAFLANSLQEGIVRNLRATVDLEQLLDSIDYEHLDSVSAVHLAMILCESVPCLKRYLPELSAMWRSAPLAKHRMRAGQKTRIFPLGPNSQNEMEVHGMKEAQKDFNGQAGLYV